MLHKKICAILRTIGSKPCLIAAARLEHATEPTYILHLRSLGLRPSDVLAIADDIHECSGNNDQALTSISFSYNLLGNNGVIAVMKALPASIQEIGLFDCGIGDEGGQEILAWARKSETLRMICVE